MGPAARNRTEPLRHLEANLFAGMEPYEGQWDGSIAVSGLPSPRDEVRWAAGVIRDLARQGYRYRDIMLTARTIEGYRDHIREVFSEFDIPVFQSEKTDILQKPVFTLITAALDAVNGGYDYEDMFRYLKTGLAGLTLDQCDRLENYVRTWDLWGSRWTGKEGLDHAPRRLQPEVDGGGQGPSRRAERPPPPGGGAPGDPAEDRRGHHPLPVPGPLRLPGVHRGPGCPGGPGKAAAGGRGTGAFQGIRPAMGDLLPCPGAVRRHGGGPGGGLLRLFPPAQIVVLPVHRGDHPRLPGPGGGGGRPAAVQPGL